MSILCFWCQLSSVSLFRPVAESGSPDPESDSTDPESASADPHPHHHFMDYAPISMTDQWHGPEWNGKPVY